MSAAPAPARVRPGRPSTGARERIRDGALDVLKRDGYAGLTTAKVAAASGQNKALIAYHFGSKQGLVAAVARQVSEVLIAEVLVEVGEPELRRRARARAHRRRLERDRRGPRDPARLLRPRLAIGRRAPR